MKFHIWKTIFQFRATVDATNINGSFLKFLCVFIIQTLISSLNVDVMLLTLQ